jgi:hypothetical protein
MLNQDLMGTCDYVIGRYRTLSEQEHSIIFALSKNLSAKSASKRENVGTNFSRAAYCLVLRVPRFSQTVKRNTFSVCSPTRLGKALRRLTLLAFLSIMVNLCGEYL